VGNKGSEVKDSYKRIKLKQNNNQKISSIKVYTQRVCCGLSILSANIDVSMLSGKFYFFPEQVLEVLKFSIFVVLEHRNDNQLIP
jgi:hypothetical protein